MARARVVLRHCESYTGLTGESWKKNQSRVITDERQIELYKSRSEFVVSDLADATARKKAAASGSSDGPPSYTEAALKRKSKPELVELGAKVFTLALVEDDNKSDLIAAILEAQG